MHNPNENQHGIAHFPISFFSMILGLAGFTIAYQKSEQILKIPFQISNYLLGLTILTFVVLSIIYLIKCFASMDEVRNEFNHPIKLSFFPTVSISILLFSVAFLSIDLTISKYLWIFGATLHFLLTIKIVSIWIHHSKFKITHMNPSWFIPAVGNVLVPVAGTTHFNAEVSWFYFSIGIIFWLILLIIFFNRIIFHDPLPDKLIPTLFILIAPPAIGFIALVKLNGEINDFSKILYYSSLFFMTLLFSQFKVFRKIQFYLSWWAYSFPISAITIASILMFHETNYDLFKYIAITLLITLNIIITFLIIRTVHAVKNKSICVAEE